MTRTELRRRILTALNDDAGAPVFWTTAEIDDAIQDGMELLAETSEGLTRTFHVPRRAGVMIYTIDGIGDNILTPYRLWLPDLQRRLEAWSLTDLDARHETWMDVSGDPWVWWPIDWRTFGIWPVPASAGGLMELDCYVWPTPLVTDTDRPEFLPADHEALVLWGEQEGRLKQHQVAEAVALAGIWAQRWARAGYRSSVEQMQAGFRVREQGHGDDWDGAG